MDMISRFFALFLLAGSCIGLPVLADQTAGTEGFVRADVLPGWRQPDGGHVAALRLELAQGWKTYWRAPGDSGIPPRFDWQGSKNLKSIEIDWPIPEMTVTNGVRSIGYKNKLILPLRMAPVDPRHSIEITGLLEIGLCKDICLPVTLRVDAVMPSDVTTVVPEIASALASLPITADEAGVSSVHCTLSPMQGGAHLLAEIEMPAIGEEEWIIVEFLSPDIWTENNVTSRQGDRLRAEADIFHTEAKPVEADPSGLRLTILSGNSAADIRGCLFK